MMKKHFFLVILCSFIFYGKCKGNSSDEVEAATVALELLEMDLEDRCSNLSFADRDIILKKQNAYKNKYVVMKNFGIFSKKESENLRNTHPSEINLQSNYNYRWKILEKMGDNELNNEDWETISKFAVEAEQLTEELQIPCKSIPCDKLPCTQNVSDVCFYSRSDVNDMLRKSRDANYLRTVWSEAQKYFTAKGKNYKQILPLVNKAAEVNDFPSAEEYWSQMVEYPDVFLKTKSLWEEIEPLYKKIHDFVRLRLEHIYRIPNNESLPVYLLGSEFGLDWTEIADKILPHRYLYDEINASLHHEEIGGKKAYKIAEKLSMNLGMKRIQSKFWEDSLFNMSCPSRLLIFCGDKYSQVITCNKTGYKEFLDAHEDITRASLTAIDFSTSIYNNFRYSVIDEAIAQLSTILAVKNMPLNGIIPEQVIMASESIHHNQNTALLLAALRILPKLSYYFLADEWRLQELNNPSEDPVKTWWEFREKYQLVKGLTNQEYDFLADDYIRNNKPYVGKFLGIILQFQILEHFQHNGENHINILTRIGKNKSFKNLIKQRINEDWFEILLNEFDIHDVDATALLEYFKPLEEYMEKAPLTQVTQTLMSRTTTPIPTTTTMKMTTMIPELEEQIKITKSPNLIESRVSIKESEKVETKPNTVLDKEEEKEVANSYATKAAWIGASIGILCLLIIIGVIGNKRFRRKPRTNNRRFIN